MFGNVVFVLLLVAFATLDVPVDDAVVTMAFEFVLFVFSSSDEDDDVFVAGVLLLPPSEEELLIARSDRFICGLDGSLLAVVEEADEVTDVTDILRGRSVGPTLRADLRKSLFAHLKLPVDEDTVLLLFRSVDLLVACGGGLRSPPPTPFSARDFFVVLFDDTVVALLLLIGDFDFDFVDSNRPLTAFDFIELLRANGTIFGGESFDLVAAGGGFASSAWLLLVSPRGGDTLLPLLYRLLALVLE